jgi:hypothetical protein
MAVIPNETLWALQKVKAGQEFLPLKIEGTLRKTESGANVPKNLTIVLNGQIVSVTQTIPYQRKREHVFIAFLPETVLRETNKLQILSIAGSPEDPQLDEILVSE